MTHSRSGRVLVVALAVLASLLVPAAAGAAPGDNLVLNPSVDVDTDGDGIPDCWMREPFPPGAGAGDTTYALVAGRTGGAAQRIEATGLAAGENRKIVPERACSSAASPGSFYDFSFWYRADAEDVAIELFHHDVESGAWEFWITYTPGVTVTAGWTQFSDVTPPVPAGKDAISFGVALFGDATADTDWIETDDYFLSPSADSPPVEPPPPGTGPPAVDEINIEGLNQPTAIEFLPGEKVAIAEKPGVIKIYDSLASTDPSFTYDISGRVSSFGDFGLTSLAAVPVGGQTYLYATYIVDDGWGDSCPNLGNVGPGHPPEDADGCPTTGRLSRWLVGADGSLGAEETVRDGYDEFCFQYITHGIDALEYDPSDGTLLMSSGDGANYNVVDNGQYNDPCGDGEPNGGAFRSQTDADYDGKVIRIAPATGAVIRIEAKGLRNPFRMSLVGDDLYISDTGWGAWEELNRITLGGATENLGWPCYEGSRPQEQYQDLGNPICAALATSPLLTGPLHEYEHLPENNRLASISAVEELGGKVYFGDVTLGFIKVIDLANPGEPVTVMSGDGVRPVDLRRTPDGGLVYVHIGEFGGSAITDNTGSIQPVVAGSPGGGGGGGVTEPSAEILVQQGPYTPGDTVPFEVEVQGFRGSLAYDWTGGVLSCDADGDNCERRELTPPEFVADGVSGSFTGPQEDHPASVEIKVVVTNTLNGETVSDSASVARIQGDPEPPGSEHVDRIAGADRIRTAVEVSRRTYGPGVPVAYVARADDFPDALAAGPLAAATGGPILLTTGDELAGPTADELARLAPGKVVVLGGSQALSDGVLAAIAATHPATERLAGATRYDTAAAIATRLGDVATVYVATGERFPDALVGGVAAGATSGAVVLTQGGEVPAATSDLLAALAPERIVLLGGELAASAGVEAALGAYGPVTRVFGADRYDTAIALSQAVHEGPSMSRDPSPLGSATVTYLATGEAFPDALSVAPTAIREGAALLLTHPGALPAGVEAELVRLGAQRAVLVGGEAAISAQVEARIDAVLAS